MSIFYIFISYCIRPNKRPGRLENWKRRALIRELANGTVRDKREVYTETKMAQETSFECEVPLKR